MAAIERKKVYSPLTDGLNDRINPAFLSEREAAEIINWEVNEKGIIEKQKGFIKDGSPFPDATDSFIRMLVNYRRGTAVDLLVMAALDSGNTNATFKVDLRKTSGDGTYPYIGHTTGTADFTNGNTAVAGTTTTWLTQLKAGDKIKTDTDTDDKYTEIASVTNDTTLVLIAGGYLGTTSGGAVAYTARRILDKDSVPASTVFNNKLIITNGADTPLTFDSVSVENIVDTDAPKAKFIEAHKNRVFMTSTSSFPSRIFWSAVNDDQSWDAAANEDVFPQDNGNIISIKSFGDSLIILKNNGKVYQIVGDFDQTAVGEVAFIRRLDVPENIGIISEKTPTVHAGFLYFLTETGIYRIDQRMFVEKTTFSMDTFIGGISFVLGPSASKSHNLDTTSQWNTGVHDGTIARSGTLSSYFDKLNINDYSSTATLNSSIFIDSSNDVHIAYVGTDEKTIKYVKWLSVDNSSTTETAIVAPNTVQHLSISVASNGNVGILFREDPKLSFVERTGGTWGSRTDITSAVTDSSDLAYTSANEPRVANYSNIAPDILEYIRRVSGTWGTPIRIATGSIFATNNVSLILNSSDDPRVSVIQSGSRVRAFKSDDLGATWANHDNITDATLTAADNIQISLDSSEDDISIFSSSGSGIRKRNHATQVTTVIDATGANLKGALVEADKNYVYYITGTSPNQVEKFIFEDSSSISDSTTNTISRTFKPQRGFFNNGVVFSSLSRGANANELIARRLAFRGIYKSQEFSDATLTAWGTYDISGQVENAATVTHEKATNTVSPIPDINFAVITNGQIIDATAAKNFVKNKITFVLGAFSGPEIDSVIMRYTGAGVDAKQPVGISFKNELFYGMAETSADSNNRVIISDVADAILKSSYPVSVFSAFKNRLYAGRSSNGDLLILKEGLNFDGAAYAADIQSKEDFLESVESEKDIFKFYILYEVKTSGTFDFSFRLDSFKTAGGSTYSSQTIDATKDGFAEVKVFTKARSVQWRLENANSDEQPAILAVVIVYGILNLR